MNRWMWDDIWESLVGRPGRTMLAVLSVAIGTLALTVLLSCIIGLSEKARGITEEFGADVLAVLPGKPGRGLEGLERQDLATLRGTLPEHRFSGVQSYTVRAPEWKSDLYVLAGDEALMQVRPWTLEAGRSLDAMDIADGQRYTMISTSLARSRGLGIGDYLGIYPYHFKIIGILRAAGAALKELSPELATGSDFAVVPHSILPIWDMRSHPSSDQLDTVFVKHAPGQESAAVISQIQQVLAPPSSRIGPVNYVSEDTLISGIQKLRRTIELTTGSVAVLCLLLGGTTLMSLMFAEVRERVGEIGLRIALGASEGDIYRLFILEALVTTGLAALIGSGSAYVVILMVREWVSFPTFIGPAIFIWPVVVALLLGMLFSFWPAHHAARITPSEALRNE